MAKENKYTQNYSDLIGAQIGYSVEQLFFPKTLLDIRDLYLAEGYRNQVGTFRKFASEEYFKSYAKESGTRNIRFDNTQPEEVFINPNPEKNTAELKWTKQLEWAEGVMSRGMIAAFEKGGDYLEAWFTLFVNRKIENARMKLQRVLDRHAHEDAKSFYKRVDLRRVGEEKVGVDSVVS